MPSQIESRVAIRAIPNQRVASNQVSAIELLLLRKD
jgi:hypothetical protein